jgi:hypothetical protein
MKFVETQELILKELRTLEEAFSAKTDYSRNYSNVEYLSIRSMRDSFNMVEFSEDLNLLYNKPDGLKFNQVYQYKLLQRYKELMKEDFPILWH